MVKRATLMLEAVSEILVTADKIQARAKELGQAISKDYAGREPVLACVLKGAAVFLADLMRNITVPVTVDFLSIASYGPGQESSGIVRMTKDLDMSISGQDVLLIEDIIDTGRTLSYLLQFLSARQPKSLEVCVLLDKPSRHLVQLPLKYVGFEIPDKFVVGYGLDYNQRYRNLPFVCTLKPSAYRSASLR